MKDIHQILIDFGQKYNVLQTTVTIPFTNNRILNDGSFKCSTIPLSKLVTSMLSAIKDAL